VLVVALVLDCFPHQQTENDDDHEDDQVIRASSLVVLVVVLVDLCTTGRPRTTTITRTNRKFPRLPIIVLVVVVVLGLGSSRFTGLRRDGEDLVTQTR
jgi:hypothetical protein